MTGEILLFARALWYGAALLAVSDCLRVLRRTVRHRGWVVAVEDLFYWIGAGFFFSPAFTVRTAESCGATFLRGWRWGWYSTSGESARFLSDTLLFC